MSSYPTFEQPTYDFPESDRTDRNHQPDYRTPGEDDMWADHTHSCADVLPVPTEQPTDHSDNEYTAADHEAATIAAYASEPQHDEATTRTATDKPHTVTPLLRRARHLAGLDADSVLRVNALRRMYRKAKHDHERSEILALGEGIKSQTERFAARDTYARIAKAPNRTAHAAPAEALAAAQEAATEAAAAHAAADTQRDAERASFIQTHAALSAMLTARVAQCG